MNSCLHLLMNITVTFEHHVTNEMWLVFVFLAATITITWIKFKYVKRLKHLFKSIIFGRLVRQAMEEELVLSHPANIALTCNYILLLGVFLTIYLGEQTTILSAFSQWQSYPVVIAWVGIIFLIKVLGYKITQFILNNNYGIKVYLYNIFLFNNVLGIILLPLLCLSVFNPSISINVIDVIICAIYLLFFIVRIIRGILSAFNFRASTLYLFLYLCTFEILPFVVVFTYFIKEIQ